MKIAPPALVLAALLLLAPSARADETFTRMIETHADSIVTVKYVLNVSMSMGGQSREQEVSGEATAVLVDPVGLAVLPSRVLNPMARGPRGSQIDIKSTPTSVRVVFPGDPKEYEAVVGATDSKLGLAFVRIRDLEGREVKAVDLSNPGDVQIGDELYGVSRLDQGFDYAPWCDRLQVIGRITKPRKLWTIRGGFTEIAHPVFTADGAIVGFVVLQEGVGGGSTLPFLLPLKVAASTIERAGRQAEKVLEDVAAAEAEAESEEAAPEEGGDGADSPEPEGGE